MNLAKKLWMTTGDSSGGQAPSGGYVDDVFSTYIYAGNGSSQTINNGIDLAGKGGLVWVKSRNGVGKDHELYDTIHGLAYGLETNNTDAQFIGAAFNSFNSNGFTLNTTGYANHPVENYASWTFRKAPKFFDVVTYTGNGVAGRQIAHSLGVAPGMIIVKCTNATWGWAVWHRGGQQDYQSFAFLNTTGIYGNHGVSGFGSPSSFDINSTSFTVGDWAGINANGATYVAYLFAHDPEV